MADGDTSPVLTFPTLSDALTFETRLWEGEGGRHRPTLRRILTEAGNGTLFPGEASRRSDDGLWDPESARPLLEHYTKTDLEQLDKAFRQYVYRVAYRSYRPAEEG